MKRALDISFFGASLVSARWNGAVSYYRGIVRALAARGHHLTFFEPDAYERLTHRDLDDPPWAEVVVYSGTDEADVHRVLERARGADVIVKASGIGVWDQLLEREVVGARRADSLTVFWDVEAPSTLERLRNRPGDPLHVLLPKFDVVLTAGGGPAVVRGYESLGAKRCAPIYCALDPDTHRPAATYLPWTSDLSLLANRLPDRDQRVEEFLFRPARELARGKFVLGGSGWADRKLPPNVKAIGHVYASEHNVFNASARAVLSVTRDSMASAGYSPGSRIFEAAGAGACVITDAWWGLEAFFEPGREILVADDGEMVTRHLHDLTPTRARTIGEAARKRALAQHSYGRRAREVEVLLLQDKVCLEVSA